MTSPVSNIHFVFWDIAQDKLLEALKVLSKVNQKNKIMIMDEETMTIAIENRVFQSARRRFSGDGCVSTFHMINKIMGESFSFAACAKEYFKARGIKLSELVSPGELELEESDQKLREKYLEMRGLIKTALWGIHNIRNLYGSKEECELAIFSGLTKTINGSKLSFEGMFEKDEKIPELPLCFLPPKTPGILTQRRTPIASESLITLASLGCKVASWHGFTTSVATTTIETYRFLYSQEQSTFLEKLSSAACTSAKIINLLSALKAK